MTAYKEMQNKDHNECPFSDEIVSYMYGELPAKAEVRFEDHIAACQICTDEFAAVSFARFETYDWKRVEFDPLETPRIVIPYPEPVVSLGERVSAWLSWVTVVPAAAVLAITVGVTFLVLSSNKQVKPNEPTLASSQPVEQPSKNVTPPVDNARVPSLEVASRVSTNGNSVPKPQEIVLKKRPALPKSQFARRTPNVKLVEDVARNFPTESVKRVPRLGINDPEEDRSLRLADLFDETNPPPQR